MDYRFTNYFLIFVTNTVVSLIAAIFLWRRRKSNSAKALFFLMVAAAEWSLAVGLEASAVDPSLKILFSKFEYLGYNSAVALLLIFVLQYTHKHQWLKNKRIIYYWIMPTITILLAATNEWHHLIWTGFSEVDPRTNLMQYYHGPWYWVNVASIYIYTATSTIILVQKAVHISSIHKNQIIILLIGIAAPWIGSLIYILDLSPIPGLNPIPITFTITGIIVILGLFRYQLLDLVPIARASLIDIMNEGLLVIDAQMRIADINPAAQHLLALPPSSIGQNIEFALSSWPELIKLCQQSDDTQKELLLDPDAPLYIDARVSKFQDSAINSGGQLLIISDITKRYKAILALFQANEALQDNFDQIASLQAQLKEQATSDALTGLLNRHHLIEILPKEISRANRGGYPITLIMLDIDHFKQINDLYGHEAGDQMLLAIGDLLRKHTRFEDFAYRYGGEEFLLILPGLQTDNAVERAEEIRQVFEEQKLAYSGIQLKATISAGIATYPQHGKTRDEIIRAADEALYAAKAAGRNRVCVYESI